MEFKNITVVKKANVYFDGNVTSRTIFLEDGSKKTLGFMQKGTYEFNTVQAERMEILGGSMSVLLPGETSYHTYSEGEAYNVPANSSFKMDVQQYVDYCCSYLS